MKGMIRALMASGAGLMFLMPATDAQAAAVRTAFTGTEVCVPASGGTVTFPDGNIHIRGASQSCVDTNSSTNVNSYPVDVFNANLGPDGSGPIWGTFNSYQDPAHTVLLFTGTFQGQLLAGIPSSRGTGVGVNAFTGLRLFVDVQGTALSGYILSPHGA